MAYEQISVQSIAPHAEEAAMDKEGQHPRSHLFTIHLWQEEVSQGQTEWRGKVHHVSSGQVHYFREWPKLILFLQTMVSASGSGSQSEQQ